MPNYSKNIVYLSKEQYQELITNETLTVNGQTITYNDNDIYVTPQAEPITDVKLNGTSIGSNGVANIPKATNSTLGLVKGTTVYGTNISNEGQVLIYGATSSDYKNGTEGYRPVTPSGQHKTVYYGLSKLAGIDLKNETVTEGIYPDSSKAAIQSMLGITDLLSTEESSTATAAHALNSTFMMDGKLHRATAAIAIGDAVEVGTNCEVVKADEVFVKRTDIATDNNAGVVKVNSSLGIGLHSSNALSINPANSQIIKAGSETHLPIVPWNQHEAIYYGLSKLAGVNLASETVTLGTYPETSKTAIRSLIGAAAANDVTVSDVQVAGTSVLSNGVANTPIANTTAFGVIKVGSGLYNSNGIVGVNDSNDANIKAGNTGTYTAVHKQHQAAFYGLAKAAGADEKDSTLSVGTYTETAKTAIRTMLGAVSSNVVAVQDEMPTAADNKVWLPETEQQGIQVPTMEDLGDYVQKTDLATTTTVGIVKANSYGIKVNNTGELYISKADIAGEVKPGVANYLPIVPSNQHAAAFYGLAKAAGDTTMAASSNAVGTYTYEAQLAIRNMLGVPGYPGTNSIKLGSSNTIIVPTSMQHEAVFYGLSKVAGVDLANETVTLGTYSETSKTAIRTMIGVPGDVQVNGTSVVSNGVANIPVASSNTFGVVKTDANSFGIKINADGKLYTDTPSLTEIKAGSQAYKPIVPANHHYATFYGLAKAAGDSTQSASSNTVGTYTSEAKFAIKQMLGITQTLTITVLTQDNVTVTGQTITIRAVDATGPVFATAAYEGQPVAFAVPSGFAYYVSVSDTLAHHFNPTTASGVITDTDVSITLQYSDFSTIHTAADIKAALDAGLDLTDLVGEQISCTWNNSTLVWDVVDYSNDTITLLTHDTLPTQLVFEPVQALMWCENGLAAGSYSFIDGSSTYYFTLTTAIPSGGQLRATTSAFQTYASMEATATLETGTVSTTEISGATSLGTTANGNLNHMSRVNYGSNNYKESALFQWLNSTEAANVPVPRITKFSRPCTYSVPGFLGALDSSFVAAIDDTTWLCSTNNTYECPTSLGGTVAKSNAYTVTAKIGLASEMEIFGSYGGTADGSAVFDLFNGATADDRKKYQPGTSTARLWWLRSPGWVVASYERYVGSSGAASSGSAYGSGGVVPAVKISKTVVSE